VLVGVHGAGLMFIMFAAEEVSGIGDLCFCSLLLLHFLLVHGEIVTPSRFVATEFWRSGDCTFLM
jgi:hypothetical protein